MAPVKETEYLREKVHDNNKLPMNENLNHLVFKVLKRN
jgi:hypothetical protein